MRRKAAVIGCGSTGILTALHLRNQGADTVLYDTPEQTAELLQILDEGSIPLVTPQGERKERVEDLLCGELSDAVRGADVILICVSLFRQKEISDRLCPLLSDGQAVVFSPGNMASLYLERKLQESGKSCIYVAEVSGNFWACRITRDKKLVSATPYSAKRLAAVPSLYTETVCRILEPFFPVLPASNILETTLNSPNVVTHVSGVMLNTVGIDKQGEDFCLFRDGLSETVADFFVALQKERNQVLEKAGLAVYSQDDGPFYQKLMHIEENPELRLFRELDGPSSMTHRYISEDAPCGVSLLISLAEEFGVDIPLTRSFFMEACFVNRTDYSSAGYALRPLRLTYKTENGKIHWEI